MSAAPTLKGQSDAMRQLLSYLRYRHFTQGLVGRSPQPFDSSNIFGGPGVHFKDCGACENPIPADPMMNMFNQIGKPVTGEGQPLAPGPAAPPIPVSGKFY